MICVLDANDYEDLFMIAYGALQDSKDSGKPFDLNAEVASLYEDFSDDEAYALGLVQAFPSQLLSAMSFDQPLMMHHLGSLQAIGNLQVEFDNLNNVRAAVGLQAVDDVDINQLKDEIRQDAQAIPQEKIPTLDKVLEQTKKFLSSIHFVFKVVSPLTTTGQQAEKDNNGNWTQTKDAEQDFYYDFFRVFHKQFLNIENAKKITIGKGSGKHTGFRLKAIGKEKILDKHLRADEQRLAEGHVTERDLNTYGVELSHFTEQGNLKKDISKDVSGIYKYNTINTLDDAKKAVGRQILKKGIGAFVTDNLGNVLYFDENYNKTSADEGKPIYHNLRSIKQAKDGSYYGAASNTQTPQEIARNTGLSIKEATDLQQKEFKQLYELREKVIKGQDVDMDITGVSPGVLNIRKEFGETKINDINWEKSDIDLNIDIAKVKAEELGEEKGQAYVTIPGHRSIPIQSDNLSVEDLNKVLDLAFTDNLVDELGNPVIPATKIKLIKHIVYTSPSGLEFYKNGNNVEVKLEGKTVTEADRQTIIDKITKPYVSKTGKESEEFARNVGQYAFHRGSSSQEFEEFTIEGNVVKTTAIDIEDHIAKHGTLRIVPNITAQGEKVISMLNGYFTFNIPVEKKEERPTSTTTASEIKEVTEAPVEQVKRRRERTKKDVPTTGLKSVRLNPMKSTPEAISAAKKWYDSNPISKHISYEKMFNVVNSNAWAEFVDGGIKLYNGSNYTVLYHEAWHGFTQHFLSEEQQKGLYEEVSKIPQGKKAIKSWAKDKGVSEQSLSQYEKYLAVEELLAEDFRQYMLSDGEKVLKQRPERNSIFRQILNFFKALFGKISGNEFVTDRTMLNVEELYTQLHIGNLNNFTPSQKNAFFKDTALYSKPKPIEGQVMKLTDQESQLIVQSIDGLISTIIDEWNAKLAPGDTRFTSAVFSDPETYLEEIYNEVYERLEDREIELQELASASEGADKIEYERLAAIISNTLDHFSPYSENEGIIPFHLSKSPYLKEHVRNIDQDTYRKTASDIAASRFDVAGNELSKIKMASDRVTFLLNNLKKYDINGNPEYNILGFPIVMQPGEAIAKITTIVGDQTSSPRDIKKALLKGAAENPWVDSLLAKLGDTSSEYSSVQNLWTGLWDILFTSEQRLHSVLINEVTDAEGNKTYEVLSGYASTVFRKVEQDFRSAFKVANNPNKYIIDTGTIGNVLDTKAILKDFKGKLNTAEQKINFIRAIGIPLSESTQIIEGFEGKNIGVRYIYDKLKALDLAGLAVTDVIKALRESTKVELSNGEVRIIKSQTSDINKILGLEAKYSGNYNNFSVMTVNGNLAHEYSRMSTRARKVKMINDAPSFIELVKIPEMSHLHPDNNPRITSLTVMRSLFKYDKGADMLGDKRPGAVLRLDLADGIQNIEDNTNSDKDYSVATSNADSYGRMMQDFYSLFLEGKPTDITPADKGTIPVVSVSTLITEGQDKNLYVDISDFAETIDGVNLGIQRTFNILLPQVEAELKEMFSIMQNLKDDHLPSIPGYTVADKKGTIRGIDFSTFDGTFSDSTKNKLWEEYNTKRNLSSMSPELRQDMIDDLDHYFTFTTEQTAKTIDRMLFVDENLKAIAKKGLIDAEKYSDADIKRLLLKAYTVNKFLHNMEQAILFYGSVAQFKDLDKRGPSINSTGRMLRTDDDAMNYINMVVKRPYADSTGNSGYKKLKSTFNSAILKEDVADSKLYDHYYDILFDELSDRIPDAEQRKEYLENKLAPYKGMETADAQGYIAFDSYRIAGILSNRWSDQQEALFMQIVNDPESVKMGDIVEYFPVRKYQHSGPLAVEGINAFAFHKFALMPLIPTVIKGTKLEQLHNAMIKNGTDYATFQTGSKVSTIVAKGSNEADNLYKDGNNINEDIVFTNNPVYIAYIKDQLDINSEYKGKVIFSTQLRKLIEEGLLANGVPVDFMPELISVKGGVLITKFDVKRRVDAWNKLVEKAIENGNDDILRASSNFYIKYKTYENKIKKLIEFRKAELIQEVGSTPEQLEKGTGDLTKLINFIQKELQHQDLTDHELNFIGVNSQGELINDLSLSPSAAQIEKLLNSIVNNRLVRQKVNGEALVQVANTLFEPKAPTDADLAEYGTKDLKSYRRDPVTGKTLGMDVKVSLQGKFNHLIHMNHKDGKRIVVYTKRTKVLAEGTKIIREIDEAATLARLNETINDPEWRADQNNLDMITMVGVRIPVQGHNSMEFMVVKEFLPPSAGNIIIPPAEIVAKSGSDFDVDKLTIMMPNITNTGGKPKVIREDQSSKADLKTIEKVEAIKQEIKDLKKQKIEESRARKLTETSLSEYTVPLNDLYKEIKRLENLVGHLDNIEVPTEANLELRHSMALKVTDLYDQYDSLEDDLYDHKDELGVTDEDLDRSKEKAITEKINKLTDEMDSISGSAIENSLMFNIRDILELPHNFESLITPNDTNIVKGDVWSELSSRREYSDKKGAWGEAGFQATRYFEVAYNIHKHEANAVGKETLGLGAVSNTWNAVFNRVGAYLNNTYSSGGGKKKNATRATILMDHHSIILPNGKMGISLSNIYDVKGENKISEVISQLMNGWVDVAKDPWIFDIQGNKQVTPVIDFLLEAGVPFESVIYFVSNPIVKEYVKEQKIALSPFSKALGLNPSESSRYREHAKIQMFKNLNLVHLLDVAHYGTPSIDYTKLSVETGALTKNKNYTKSAKALANKEYSDVRYNREAIGAFLHYLELENLAKEVSNIKLKLNYDTSRSNTLFDAAKTEADLKEVKEGNLFPQEIVEAILQESPIGSFQIAPFQMKLWGPLFDIRNNQHLNDFIIDLLGDKAAVNRMEERFGSVEKWIETFKNDMVVNIFTDTVKKFNINAPTYKGLVTNLEGDIKTVAHLDRGVAVSADKKTIYIDKETLDNQLKSGSYSKPSNMRVAPVPMLAFMNDRGVVSNDEYYKFVVEREYQRALWPFDKLSETEYFKYRYEKNLIKLKDVGTDLTAEDRERKILQKTYEEILRDKALDNILNIWKLFKSDNTFADQLFEIKEMHPELTQRYNIVRDLIMSQADELGRGKDEHGNRKKIASYKNIILRDNRVPPEDMNIYYTNMTELNSDPGLEDNVENNRVAQFFDNLPLVGLLQSGLNTKDGLSFMRAMPTDKIQDIIASSKEQYDKLFSDPARMDLYLSAFASIFNQHNNIKRITVRRRYKDYKLFNTVVPDANYNLTKHEIPVDKTMALKFGEDFDAVLAGEMTATSRAETSDIQPGDVIEFRKKYGRHTRSILVRATSYERPLSDMIITDAIEREPSIADKFDELVEKDYTQFSFELISDEELAASTDKDYIDINPETRNQLETLIKNNPNVIFVLENTVQNDIFDGSHLKKYDNILTLTLNKDIAALDESLDKLKELYDSGAKIAMLNRYNGYGKQLIVPLKKNSNELLGQELFERLSTRLYEMLGYENINSKTTSVVNMIKEKQAEIGIIEYALEVPYEELDKARERLNCKL